MLLRLIHIAIPLGTLGLIALSVSGWAQGVHPLLDTASHFRLLAVCGLLLAAVVAVWGRRPGWAVASVVTVAVSLVLTVPYLPGFKRGWATTVTAERFEPLTIVQMNLLYDNDEAREAAELLVTAKGDIYVLQEVTRITQVVLERLRASHPHQLSCLTDRVGSVAIVSRFPFAGEKVCLQREGFASVPVERDGAQLTIASFHARWPWPAGQNEQLARLRGRLATLGTPAVLAGDFNAAPWSAMVQRAATWSGLRTVSGLVQSWGPPIAGLAMLPIDQTLVSDGIGVVSRERLGRGGSDHFAIATTIVIDPSLRLER